MNETLLVYWVGVVGWIVFELTVGRRSWIAAARHTGNPEMTELGAVVTGLFWPVMLIVFLVSLVLKLVARRWWERWKREQIERLGGRR